MRWLGALLLLAAPFTGCIATDDRGDEDVDPTAAGLPGFSSTSVFPGTYDTKGDFSKVLVPGPLEILAPQIETLASDIDGAQLQIGYFLPDVAEGTKVPVVVYASPYLFGGMTPAGMTQEFVHEQMVENFVPHGYAVAFVPIRGTSDQGGCMDLMGPGERADLDQAITWLGTQPWSNGAVGMMGLSYDGSTPWQVASMGNPYLKTIVPMSGVSDIHDLMFPNGTSELRGPLVLNALYYTYGFLDYNAVQNGRSPGHMVEGVICPESFEGFAASVYSGVQGERDPMGFWAERDSRPGVEESYKGSIFLVHGLQDWNVDPHHAYPWVNHLEAKGIVVKHLLGQWDHSFPDTNRVSDSEWDERQRWDFAETLLHWFDRWLKGDTTVDLGPLAQVQDSDGMWRDEPAGWPPHDAVATTFYLAPGGKLVTEPENGMDGSLAAVALSEVPFFGDPPVPLCPACPAFTTEPFADGLRFAGIPKVHVTVTPIEPAGQVAAWLYVVDGGQWRRAGWGEMDIRFHDGTGTAQTVTPGQAIQLQMVLEPLDVVVPPGASLALVFHQGSYGDHVLEPGLPVRIEAGGEQSTLVIHTFLRGPEAFFEPPAMS